MKTSRTRGRRDLFGFPCCHLPRRYGTWVWWLACSVVIGVFHASGSDQTQWGQAWSRNMVSEEKHLPESFDPKTGRNVKWTAALGTETHSTPIVARGRIYIGTNNGT